jgi:hypothetical protein
VQRVVQGQRPAEVPVLDASSAPSGSRSSFVSPAAMGLSTGVFDRSL